MRFTNSKFIKEKLPKADILTLNVVEPNAKGVNLRLLHVSNPESGLSGEEVAVVDMVALWMGLVLVFE